MEFVSEESKEYANNFIAFLNEACTAFHAVEAAKKRLLLAGFTELSEKSMWSLEKNGKYFFTRGGTTLMAFAVGGNYIPGNGFTVIGAHTDSPCLRIKPVTTITRSDCLMLNTQPYGGGLWHTWFDRDLGIAGKIVVTNSAGGLDQQLVRINKAIARIPNLAIHLTEDRDKFSPNLHEHCMALLTMIPNLVTHKAPSNNTTMTRLNPVLLDLVSTELNIPVDSIVDLELQLIDIQPSCFGGLTDELVVSGRLDNLCSSYQALSSLIDESKQSLTNASNIYMIMLFDHEEVGSSSCTGAGSSLFMNTLTLINQALTDGLSSTLMNSLRKSFVVSIDMAHGLHPNYSAKHDSSMAPRFNGGLVIKHNANQRYATTSSSASMFREFAKLADVPCQEFAVKSGSGCGSTIGPIISTLSGIMTVDCGTPQYSMHSIRECMATSDAYTGYRHLRSTFQHHFALAAKSNLD